MTIQRRHILAYEYAIAQGRPHLIIHALGTLAIAAGLPTEALGTPEGRRAIATKLQAFGLLTPQLRETLCAPPKPSPSQPRSLKHPGRSHTTGKSA